MLSHSKSATTMWESESATTVVESSLHEQHWAAYQGRLSQDGAGQKLQVEGEPPEHLVAPKQVSAHGTQCIVDGGQGKRQGQGQRTGHKADPSRGLRDEHVG